MFPGDLNNWLLVFVRVSALLAVFPLFSMQNFPVRLRVALGALVSFLIVPILPPLVVRPDSVLTWIGLAATEAGIGLLLGFVSRVLFYILEFAGGLMATEMGFNAAASFDPFSNTRSEAPGVMLFYLGAVIFLSLDLHHWLLVALQQTYTLLPIGTARLREALFSDIINRVSRVFLIGLLMAAPIIAITFLINLVFSVLGRAVPQMNIFAESLAFRILAGLSVLGLALNMVGQHIVNYLRRLPEDLLRVAQLLRAG
jgi:flagellar biosynthetic protein FliR